MPRIKSKYSKRDEHAFDVENPRTLKAQGDLFKQMILEHLSTIKESDASFIRPGGQDNYATLDGDEQIQMNNFFQAAVDTLIDAKQAENDKEEQERKAEALKYPDAIKNTVADDQRKKTAEGNLGDLYATTLQKNKQLGKKAESFAKKEVVIEKAFGKNLDTTTVIPGRQEYDKLLDEKTKEKLEFLVNKYNKSHAFRISMGVSKKLSADTIGSRMTALNKEAKRLAEIDLYAETTQKAAEYDNNQRQTSSQPSKAETTPTVTINPIDKIADLYLQWLFTSRAEKKADQYITLGNTLEGKKQLSENNRLFTNKGTSDLSPDIQKICLNIAKPSTVNKNQKLSEKGLNLDTNLGADIQGKVQTKLQDKYKAFIANMDENKASLPPQFQIKDFEKKYTTTNLSTEEATLMNNYAKSVIAYLKENKINNIATEDAYNSLVENLTTMLFANIVKHREMEYRHEVQNQGLDKLMISKSEDGDTMRESFIDAFIDKKLIKMDNVQGRKVAAVTAEIPRVDSVSSVASRATVQQKQSTASVAKPVAADRSSSPIVGNNKKAKIGNIAAQNDGLEGRTNNANASTQTAEESIPLLSGYTRPINQSAYFSHEFVRKLFDGKPKEMEATKKAMDRYDGNDELRKKTDRADRKLIHDFFKIYTPALEKHNKEQAEIARASTAVASNGKKKNKNSKTKTENPILSGAPVKEGMSPISAASSNSTPDSSRPKSTNSVTNLAANFEARLASPHTLTDGKANGAMDPAGPIIKPTAKKAATGAEASVAATGKKPVPPPRPAENLQEKTGAPIINSTTSPKAADQSRPKSFQGQASPVNQQLAGTGSPIIVKGQSTVIGQTPKTTTDVTQKMGTPLASQSPKAEAQQQRQASFKAPAEIGQNSPITIGNSSTAVTAAAEGTNMSVADIQALIQKAIAEGKMTEMKRLKGLLDTAMQNTQPKAVVKTAGLSTDNRAPFTPSKIAPTSSGSLMDQINKGIQLKKAVIPEGEKNKPAASGGLMEQINKGVQLKKVVIPDGENGKPAVTAPKNAMMEALQKRINKQRGAVAGEEETKVEPSERFKELVADLKKITEEKEASAVGDFKLLIQQANVFAESKTEEDFDGKPSWDSVKKADVEKLDEFIKQLNTSANRASFKKT